MTALEKQQKKISVIIPVYNAEKYIRETLDSIIKQSYKNLEIILIDNGSKDRSPDIIQKYEAKYPEIHMIEESGKGPGASRNRGLKLAKKSYMDMMFRLVEQMADKEGVTEQLKAENPMLWVVRMNEIQARAREIINREIIYT